VEYRLCARYFFLPSQLFPNTNGFLCRQEQSPSVVWHQLFTFKEPSMNTETRMIQEPVLSFEAANWIATDCMPRDQEQSHRLHEPTQMINSIDPITGRDIGEVAGHPHLADGILTVYFESAKTQQAYLDTPFDHPVGKLPGTPAVEVDRGG